MDLGSQKEQDRYTGPQGATEGHRVSGVDFGDCPGLVWAVLVWVALVFPGGERSERASAASEASEAIRLFHMFQDCPSLSEIFNRKSMLAKAFLFTRASRSLAKTGL